MRSRRKDLLLAAVLAAASYIPLLLTKPGMVAADTKQYLYLDPARLTSGAASMWDPNVGLGTVTHQNIGYLFPMGPYFSVAHWLHVPFWVSQRVWMGSLLLAAGLGVAYCARRLGLEGAGRAVAAVAYTFSPYLIDYLDRTSAILMPWAGLGWMVGLTAVAARTGRWRHAAWFAVIVALAGGVNATSIILVLVAPALWLIYGAAVTREVTPRRAIETAGRIGILSAAVSLWWAAGLWAEGTYGINILRVTETVPTVARTSSAPEVLRGLGYWYFYGWDKVQPWTLPSVEYTQSLWLVAVSYAVPGVALILGFFARWRYRAFALALAGLGTLIAVGAYPYGHPSVFGKVLESFSSGSTVALAMRSVDRVVPIVILGLALMMGSGVAAIRLRWPRTGSVAAVACVALVAADMPPMWTGAMIASNLDRPSSVPSYWSAAARYLDSVGTDRVLAIPGEDFGAYSWGVTMDPVLPGLMARPYISRQVVPSGTPPSADLVQAFMEPLQEGTLNMNALAPMARLISAGQILVQSDLQYERYHLPLPQQLWQEVTSDQAALGQATAFGAPNPAPTIRYPLNNEIRLGIPAGTPQPPALAVFDVKDPRPMARAENLSRNVVVAGDGSGIVEAASAGLLSNDPAVLYSASYSKDPAALASIASRGATLVVTDTNALAERRWGGLRDNVGEVQQPGVEPLAKNPSDYTLPVFAGAGTNSQTVAETGGVKAVTATGYGPALSFTPEDRPLNAVDGNPSTAWTYGAYGPAEGGRIEIQLDHPVTASQVTLAQALFERANRRISRVTVTFDGARPVIVNLNRTSYTSPGQTVKFSPRTFSRIDVTVDAATGEKDKRYDGLAPVGFSEISIPGVPSGSSTLRLPQDLLDAVGKSSLSNQLDILMSRQRAIEPPRHDPEADMARSFSLPTARTFAVGGTAEINAGDSDYLINQLVGLTPPPTADAGSAVVLAANSSTRLDGDRNARANAAVDGDPATSWIAESGPQQGEWIDYQLSRPITLDHLDMKVLNDGRHSLPSRLTISAGGRSETVDVPVPPIGNGRPQDATSTVSVTFPPLTGNDIRLTIDAVHQVRSLDYYATFKNVTDILPVGVAELGLPGVEQPVGPSSLPAQCQPGLLSIDGNPVDIEITGTTADALAGEPLRIEPCGNSADGIPLRAGRHVVTTSPRLPSGWSIDSLSFESAPGGNASAPATTRNAPVAPSAKVKITSHNRTSWDLQVRSDGKPFWLVLGQSYSSGWTATLADGRSLGAPQLVDGYATGWLVPAGAIKGAAAIHIVWSPQRVVWAALVLSAAGLLVSLLLAVWPERSIPAVLRRRRARRGATGSGSAPAASAPWPASRAVLDWSAPAPSWRPVLLAALGWGLLAGLASRPLIGVAGTVAVLVASRLRLGRLLVRLAASAALVAIPVYVVQQQDAHRYLPTIDWPTALSAANDIAWVALVLLGADVVAGAVRLVRGKGSAATEPLD